MTKSKAFAAKSGQNISSSVGVTKSRTFAAKSGQNISSALGVTKSRKGLDTVETSRGEASEFTKTRAFPTKYISSSVGGLLQQNLVKIFLVL